MRADHLAFGFLTQGKYNSFPSTVYATFREVYFNSCFVEIFNEIASAKLVNFWQMTFLFSNPAEEGVPRNV